MVGAAALLVACFQGLDLKVTNTCGQPVAVGLQGGADSPVSWYPLAEGGQEIVPASGYSEMLVTVVPADADQTIDHTRIDLGDLDTTPGTETFDQANLDLASAGLCP